MNKNFTKDQQNAWIAWLRCSQQIIAYVEQELKDGGFPPLAWYDALLELDFAKEGRLRFSELGEKMLLKKFNVSRLVDRMEKQGLVKRESCNSDARGAYVAITTKGKKLRLKIWPSYRDAVYKCFLNKMNDQEIHSLTKLLKIISSKPYKN